MQITKITIGRLYNLGSYEHVRYELTAEVPAGESAATAIIGMEKLMSALSPKTSTHSRDELDREKRGVDEMHRLLSDDGPEEFGTTTSLAHRFTFYISEPEASPLEYLLLPHLSLGYSSQERIGQWHLTSAWLPDR